MAPALVMAIGGRASAAGQAKEGLTTCVDVTCLSHN